MTHAPKPLPIRVVLLAIACAVAVAACDRGTAPPDQAATPTATPSASEPAQVAEAPAQPALPDHPSLQVQTVDGVAYDLADHRGRWVVVNFWATWCKPCLKEMPELSALDAMRENIEVIGLAYEEIEPAEMKAFLEKRPVVYPVAILDTFNPPADFATPRGLPMTYLIDPNGRVADRFLGPVTAHEIESAIASAEGGKAAP